MGSGYSMKAKANEADVYIYEDIGAGWFGGVSAKQFATDLKALGTVETINVHINSYGGEVFDGVAIYRQLVDHKAKVISHIDGVAASIASVIAMAGDEIRISEAGFVMIHDASGGVMGRAGDMRQMADLLDTITSTIADVYEARTNQARAAIIGWMGEERWFTAAEAVDLKFADTVVQNLRVAAHIDMDKHTFKHLPPALVASSQDRPAMITAPVTHVPSKSPLAARVALQAAQRASRKASAA